MGQHGQPFGNEWLFVQVLEVDLGPAFFFLCRTLVNSEGITHDTLFFFNDCFLFFEGDPFYHALLFLFFKLRPASFSAKITLPSARLLVFKFYIVGDFRRDLRFPLLPSPFFKEPCDRGIPKQLETIKDLVDHLNIFISEMRKGLT